VKAWSKDLQNIGRQATEVGSMLTKAITLPLAGVAAASVKAASDFESSFAGVRKTVQATEAEFAQMSGAFRQLAKEIPVNVNELNRLGEAAGALGIPKAEIVDFARVMAMLGVTTNLTADQAAESIAKIQNIFGAAGQSTENFASTLVALGNDGVSTEAQIVSMAERIAGAGNAVGMTQGEVLAFASALSSVGIEAEMGGSAISRVFIDIASAVSQGGDAVKGFATVAGLSTREFSKLFKEDAAGAVEAFITGLSRIKTSGGDLLGTLEALGFQEIRVRDTLLRTAGAGDLLTRALDLQGQAWESNTALTREAEVRFATFTSQLQLFWNQVRDVGIELGTALLPAVRDLLSSSQPLIQRLSDMAKWFAALPAPTKELTVQVLALTAAIGPLLIAFGAMLTSAGSIVAMFGAGGLVTKALTAYRTGIIAATGATTAFGGTIATLTGAGFVVALGLAIAEVAKAMANLYNVWKSGASMWAFFSARDDDNFVRRWLGLSQSLEATVDAMKPMASHGQQVATTLSNVRSDAARATVDVKNFAIVTEDAAKAAKKAAEDLKAFQASVDYFGTRANHATFNALVPFKAAVDDADEGLRDLVSGSLAEAGAATAAAEEEMRQWAMTTGAVLMPALKDTRTQIDATKTSTKGLWQGVRELAGAFTELAQIAGKGGLGDFLKQVGELIATVGIAEEAGKRFGESLKNITDHKGTFVENIPQMASGLASLGAAFTQITRTANGAEAAIGGFATTAQFAFSAGASGATAGWLGLLGAGAAFAISEYREMKRLHEMREEFGRQTRRIIEDLKHLVPAMGNVSGAAKAMGLDFQAALTTLGAQQQREALLDFMDDFKRKLAETNDAFRPLIQQANDIGLVLPSSLKDSIGLLVEMGVIVGDNADAFRSLADRGEVDWKRMQALAEEFGISVESLGPKFTGAKIGDEAKRIINAFDTLKRSGADVGGVLVGMKDEVLKLVGASLEAGVKIPENFKPIIASLLESNQLTVDERNALEGLDEADFGPAIVSQFEMVLTKLQELIDVLIGRLMPGLDKTGAAGAHAGQVIADQFDQASRAAEDFASTLNSIPSVSVAAHFEPTQIPHLAAGGIVTAPTLAMIGERGAEAVVPLDRAGRNGRGLFDEEGLSRRIGDHVDRLMARYDMTMRVMLRDAMKAGAI
jgi:TP901 family phage tail tape measure protein